MTSAFWAKDGALQIPYADSLHDSLSMCLGLVRFFENFDDLHAKIWVKREQITQIREYSEIHGGISHKSSDFCEKWSGGHDSAGDFTPKMVNFSEKWQISEKIGQFRRKSGNFGRENGSARYRLCRNRYRWAAGHSYMTYSCYFSSRLVLSQCWERVPKFHQTTIFIGSDLESTSNLGN